MHIILTVLVVFRAVPRNLLRRQIADPPFQVVGRDLAEWPQCVALESRRSNQISAGAGPPTAVNVKCIIAPSRHESPAPPFLHPQGRTEFLYWQIVPRVDMRRLQAT